ncbi:hypothetical protein HNQ60_000867 [Povalibacter uvarum]|uniref:Uncharacterized protein n=1 Tax=Povalibacter uvarum TaxID=732238 RepID=A0A841HFZ1_9GAMM|nr:two-component regulator propeller domain-containing protein [Povalibacter uvarum]MBB6092021.1 hypothetical protein [Povalibacter uvarum]
MENAEGFSQSRVGQITQDDKGFMWFGTQYGLIRFDGYGYTAFAPDARTQNQLSGVFIHAILKDRSGRLWVASDLPKYSARQLQEFLQILVSNVVHVDEDGGRHAAGDSIARAYPSEVAIKALEKLATGHPRDKHVAFVGLDVLYHRVDPDLLPRVLALHGQLLASQEEWFRKA